MASAVVLGNGFFFNQSCPYPSPLRSVQLVGGCTVGWRPMRYLLHKYISQLQEYVTPTPATAATP